MRTSKQTRREAKELFRSCFLDGLLDDGRVRDAVRRIAEINPRGYTDILSHFQRLVRLELDRGTARVESPVPLTPELRADVKARLDRLYGPGLEISFAQNASLLGGLRVQVGSDVYDGSVQSRLTALQGSL